MPRHCAYQCHYSWRVKLVGSDYFESAEDAVDIHLEPRLGGNSSSAGHLTRNLTMVHYWEQWWPLAG